MAARLQMKSAGLTTLAAVCLLPSSGCGKPVHALGHGASTEPKVTVLLSDTAGAAAADAGAAAPVTAVAGYGTLKGRIAVSGTVPALAPLLAQGAPTKDAICSKNTIPDESVVVGPNNGLANVFIYLKKVPGGEIPPAPSEPQVVDQKGCRFLPHTTIVRIGQDIVFKNDDPVAHNTAFAPQNAAAFNNIISGNDRAGIAYKYQKPEAVPVRAKCDIHAWMGSYHLPLNHPWGVVTAEDGSFEIKGVPAAAVEFVIWHEKAGYINRGLKVTIPVDGVVEQEITVDAAKLEGK